MSMRVGAVFCQASSVEAPVRVARALPAQRPTDTSLPKVATSTPRQHHERCRRAVHTLRLATYARAVHAAVALYALGLETMQPEANPRQVSGTLTIDGVWKWPVG